MNQFRDAIAAKAAASIHEKIKESQAAPAPAPTPAPAPAPAPDPVASVAAEPLSMSFETLKAAALKAAREKETSKPAKQDKS